MSNTNHDRAFGTVELITSNTVVLRVRENGQPCKRREVIARGNPNIDMSDLRVGDKVTFWSPRIAKGWITAPTQTEQDADQNTINIFLGNGYKETGKKCLYCDGTTMKRRGHEVCIHCHHPQIRE